MDKWLTTYNMETVKCLYFNIQDISSIWNQIDMGKKFSDQWWNSICIYNSSKVAKLIFIHFLVLFFQIKILFFKTLISFIFFSFDLVIFYHLVTRKILKYFRLLLGIYGHYQIYNNNNQCRKLTTTCFLGNNYIKGGQAARVKGVEVVRFGMGSQ